MNDPVDWQAINRRLAASEETIRNNLEPCGEDVARILRSRAEDLAREPKSEEKVRFLDTIEFQLAWERYAIESRHVREVHALENLTPLPCTPDFVLGIANVRGEMIAVIDIKKFFGLPEKGLGDLDKLIVLESAGMGFGILADAVLGVRQIPVAEIQPPLPTFTGVRLDYLHGVVSGKTVVLDAQKLMDDDGIIVREAVDG